jgi:uncharacterized protein (DUF1499 family)
MHWILAVLALLLLPVAILGGLSAFSRRPDDLGMVDGRLRPCPNKPNCVCTFDQNPEHTIDPLPENTDAVWQRLQSVVGSLPGARIVSVTDTYLHAEFTSRLFRFVDDVEFMRHPSGGIHFRSASRVGHSDLGVNRARMEGIRQRIETR